MRKVKEFLVPLGRYAAVVVGVIVLAMLILPFLGYATYGDRPPAGWRAIGPISVSECAGYAAFVAEFVVLFIPTLLFYAAITLAGVRLCESIGARWLGPRFLGAFGGGIAALVSLGGAGWYISLGALVGAIGCLTGILAGVRWLPRKHALQDRASAA